MKNKKFILMLLPLLLSCGGAGNSDKIDLSTTIEELSKGLKVETICEEKYNGNTNTYYLKSTSKSKEFSYILYSNESKKEKKLHEYYAFLEDEYIRAVRLGINNEYNYHKVYNPMTSEFYKWSDGYDNLFSLLEASDFNKTTNTEYALLDSKLQFASPYLSTLLYGNPGMNITSFSLSKKNKVLQFNATAVFEGYSTYEYTFVSNIISTGLSVKMDYRDIPYAEVEDEVFEKMITDLKSNNYTAIIVNEDNFEVTESWYYSNEDKVRYKYDEYDAGFYVNDEGLVQEVIKEGNSFYKVGEAMEGEIAEIMPSFDVAREVFYFDGDKYTLKSNIEGDMFSFIVLEAFADELSDFTIEVQNNGYIMTNIRGDAITTVTFINIGTTDVGFSKETVLDRPLGATWAEMLDADSYQLLVDIVGEDIASTIPVPEGYGTWSQLSEEPEYVYFASEAKSTIDNDLYLYSIQLAKAGFTISQEEGINGGTMGLMGVRINGKYQVLVVEFLHYIKWDLFAILVYFAE